MFGRERPPKSGMESEAMVEKCGVRSCGSLMLMDVLFVTRLVRIVSSSSSMTDVGLTTALWAPNHGDNGGELLTS
jgi:hypothetical protein